MGHELVKFVNRLTKYATREELETLQDQLNLNPKEEEIFIRYYVKNQPISFIADELGHSYRSIQLSLMKIRFKVDRVISTQKIKQIN